MVIFLFVSFFWLALFTSQSAIDLADTLLIGFALYHAYKNQKLSELFKGYRQWWLWIAWLLVLVAGFVFGPGVEFGVAAARIWEFRWFISFLCYLYIFSIYRPDARQIKTWMYIYMLLGIVSLGLYFYRGETRAGGLFDHSMPFAHTMGPTFLFLIYFGFRQLFLEKKMFVKIEWILTLGLGALLIVLSLTRGVWIGVFAGAMVSSFMLGKRSFILALAGTLVIFACLFLGSEKIHNRILGATPVENLTVTTEDQSNNARVALWKTNWQIFRDFPVVGIGYGENRTHLREYFTRLGYPPDQFEGHAHNQYLQFLSGTGILGLSCFLFFVFSILCRATTSLYRSAVGLKSEEVLLLCLGAYAGLISFLVAGFTEVNFGIAKNRFVFLFLAAFLYARSQRKNDPPVGKRNATVSEGI